MEKIHDELKYARLFKNDFLRGKWLVQPETMEEALTRVPLLLGTGNLRFKIKSK